MQSDVSQSVPEWNSAEVLQQAAAQIREDFHDYTGRRVRTFHLAVADGLDAIATRVPEIEPQYEHLLDREQRAALAVARAYLGEPGPGRMDT